MRISKLNQKLFLFILLLFLGLILFIGSSFLMKPRVIEIIPTPAQISETISDKIQPTEENQITLILVGDIMLNRGVEYMVGKEGDGDYSFPFLKIVEDLKGTKLLFGNLEGPISDKGTKVGSIYSFRAEPKVIEGLTFAGFDVISLANNHAFDYGREALEDTFLKLKTAGVDELRSSSPCAIARVVDEDSFISTRRSARVIDYVGAGFNQSEAYSPVIKEIQGTKIGFLAYTNLGPETWKATERNSGIAWINENDFEKIKKDIENAKSQADILIVSLHSGEEYLLELTQFQIEFSKAAIDAGANIVIGHHPHVIQRNEKYKDGWIFYSLGNFVFDQAFSEKTMQGQIVEVLIENGKIKEVIPKEVKINNYFQPEVFR